MAIERSTFLYEILCRFGPEGYRGSHAIDLERIADGDEIIAEKELPARAVTEAEFKAFLEGQSAALIEAADHAREHCKAAEAERDAAVKAQAEAEAALAKAEAERDAALAAKAEAEKAHQAALAMLAERKVDA